MWLFKPFYLRKKKDRDRERKEKKQKQKYLGATSSTLAFSLQSLFKRAKIKHMSESPGSQAPPRLLCKAILGPWPSFSLTASVHNVHCFSRAPWARSPGAEGTHCAAH